MGRSIVCLKDAKLRHLYGTRKHWTAVKPDHEDFQMFNLSDLPPPSGKATVVLGKVFLGETKP